MHFPTLSHLASQFPPAACMLDAPPGAQALMAALLDPVAAPRATDADALCACTDDTQLGGFIQRCCDSGPEGEPVLRLVRHALLERGRLSPIVRDGSPSRMLQSAWTHGSARNFLTDLKRIVDAMKKEGFSVTEAERAFAVRGAPADAKGRQLLTEWRNCLKTVKEAGLGLARIEVEVDIRELPRRPDLHGRIEMGTKVQFRFIADLS